jgi:hypothetical protein
MSLDDSKRTDFPLVVECNDLIDSFDGRVPSTLRLANEFWITAAIGQE